MAVPRIDYTARDYDTNLAALKECVRINYPDIWNSLFEGDLGEALLELIAYDFSMLSYILDMQTQECFLDTLTLRESLLHFARLTGYAIQRAAPASIELAAEVTNPPGDNTSYIIRKGSEIRSKDGQTWEVQADYEIASGKFTPIDPVVSFADVPSGLDPDTGIEAFAFVRIQPNSSVAELCDKDGARLVSSINFGALVGQGHILRLLGFEAGGVPDINHDTYAIIEVSKASYDVYDNTTLYLDRVWDAEEAFVGTWAIENRNILVTQGKTYVEEFTTPAGADERKNYSVQAAYYPVIGSTNQVTTPSGFFGSVHAGFRGADRANSNLGVTVTINGNAWLTTSSLLFETGEAQAFEVDTDEFDRLTLRFGDGIFGSLVPASASVVVSYRVGGGVAGNLPPQSFDSNVVAHNLAVPNQPVTVYVSNPYTVGRGGADRESLADAKRSIPQFMRTNDRAVTVEDYAYLASSFTDATAGRIKLAKGVLHRNTVPREQNIVWVYAWVEGENGHLLAPTLTLKGRLLDFLNARKMITDEVVIVDGQTSLVPVIVRYRHAKSADATVVAGSVQVAVNSVFAALTPGDNLYVSDLYEAIGAVADVEFFNILQPAENYVANNAYELFSNTVQLGTPTKLLTPAFKDATTFVVASTVNFEKKMRIVIYEHGKTPTTAIIEDKQTGGVLQVRADTPLRDTYSVDADVVPSDYHTWGWAYERRTDVFVRYISGTGSTATADAVAKRIRDYFDKTLRPEETLSKARLETLVLTTPNVITCSVTFGSMDTEIAQIVPATREKVVLGTLTINNALAT